MLKFRKKTVSAFAPATVSNLAVGFDILGFPVDGLGDTVTLTQRNDSRLVIQEIVATESIATDIEKNTAGVALEAMRTVCGITSGFDIKIEKGIPLASGLGGSAASAVAAVVACNQFLQQPQPLTQLAKFALCGERVASGEEHGDNVIPCLYGGLTLIRSLDPIKVVSLPKPSLTCVLLHPQLKVETRRARAILPTQFPLNDFVKQSANLAGFISALFQQDFTLLRDCMQDVLIEPYRAQLVENFYAAKQAALDHGALAASLSGSGPTLFAFAEDNHQAKRIEEALIDSFQQKGIPTDSWVTTIRSNGATITE